MPKVSQLNDATATALSVRLGMGSAKQYLHRWWQSSDGTDLSLAYDRAIAAGQRTLRIAEGNWTWSTPKDYVTGLRIIGEGDVVRSGGVGGTKITAPNGFLKNDNTTRKQIIIQNLHIIGDGDSVGIDGPFGGTVQGCKLEGFDVLIRNMSGFLAFYRECAFANADFGIQTADANGSVVEQCWFNDDVAVQITTRDGTPQSGVNSGLPFILRENNHNLTDLTTVALRIRGQVSVRDCYFEKFSGSVANTMVDLEVNRFDHQGFIMENCELNGQSANCTGLYINGSHLNLENWTEGRVTCNRFIGLAHHVVYGPNNRVPGLKIYGNSRTTGDFNIVVENSYQDQHVPTWDGWTYLTLGTDFSNSTTTMADVTGMAFTPAPGATYIVEGLLRLRSAAATTGPQTGIVWPTNVGDGVYYTQQASAAGSTTPRYGNTSANFTSGVADIADATGSWPQFLSVSFDTASNASGDFKLTLRSEVAASNVTMKAGSFIRYRRIA